MRKWSLFLTLYFCLCLLAACAAGGSKPEPAELPSESAVITCRIVERAEQWGGTLILAGADGGFGDVYTLDWTDDSLRAGDLVEITFTGGIQESFPMGLTGVTEVRALEGGFNNLAALYLRVLEDLWEKDSGLNEGLDIMGLDLSQTSLTDAERAAIGWYFSCLHGSIECVSGTLEAMIDWGYVTAHPLTTSGSGIGLTEPQHYFYEWENGIHFSITEQKTEGVYSLTPVAFDARKWRSSLGAYWFSDCTAVQSALGEWSEYHIGAELIS